MYKSRQSSTKRPRLHRRTRPAAVSAPVKNERPKCNQCPRSFSKKANLLAHLRIHTGDKRYHCTLCGLDFVWKSSLNYHARKKHNDYEVVFISGPVTMLAAIKKKTGEICDAPSDSDIQIQPAVDQEASERNSEEEAEQLCEIPHATASYPLGGDRDISNFGDERPYDSRSLDLLVGPYCDPILCEMQTCGLGTGLEKIAEQCFEMCVSGECDLAGNPHEDREDLVVESLSPAEEEEWSVSKMALDAECEITSEEAMDVLPVDRDWWAYFTHPVDQNLDPQLSGIRESASSDFLRNDFEISSVPEQSTRSATEGLG